MSLLGLAIVGRSNEPLYICDCVRIIKESESQVSPADEVADDGSTSTRSDQKSSGAATTSKDLSAASHVDDPLGILGITAAGGLRTSLGFEHRLLIHSALDQLEESISTTAVGLPVVPVRSAGGGGFLGVLARADEDKWVYGYITATNVKILILAEASAREAEIRQLLSDIHEYYVRYCLNPLRDIKADITSEQFDKNITRSVRLYDSKRQSTVTSSEDQ